MGLYASSDVYQRSIEQLLEGYPGHVITDDILITGATETKHDANLHSVRMRLQEINLKLSACVCVQKPEVLYTGHILSADNPKPGSAKVRAIIDTKVPVDKAELLQFLGMTKYLSQVRTAAGDTASALNELLKKDIEWQWADRHSDEGIHSSERGNRNHNVANVLRCQETGNLDL